MLAPVVIFVYARPEHTIKTVESLAKNMFADETDVYIFSDGAKSERVQPAVDAVRAYIDTLGQRMLFKSVTVTKTGKNNGLANSVITGVTEVIRKHGKVIVVEDDLISSLDFLQYMNCALDFYRSDIRIWSICGYTFRIQFPRDYTADVYLSYRGGSWGWATWLDRWHTVDWQVKDYHEFRASKRRRTQFNRGGRDMCEMMDNQMRGIIDSWAIRWCYAQSKRDMLTVYPRTSRIANIGLDGSGTHSGVAPEFVVSLQADIKPVHFEAVQLDERIVSQFCDRFGTRYEWAFKRFKRSVKRLICMR